MYSVNLGNPGSTDRYFNVITETEGETPPLTPHDLPYSSIWLSPDLIPWKLKYPFFVLLFTIQRSTRKRKRSEIYVLGPLSRYFSLHSSSSLRIHTLTISEKWKCSEVHLVKEGTLVTLTTLKTQEKGNRQLTISQRHWDSISQTNKM